ncbi:MAG TPA: lipid-binding SYLF domain-containing protein [Pyrinomonadaceae bacterium]|nr:lipid-binding SYLF domain-containing protein [Pyrinomonadaceae bacterium]
MNGPLLRKVFVTFLLAAMTLTTLSAPAAAQQRKRRAKPSRSEDAARHATKSAKVFNDIMRVPDRAIPRELVSGAEAVVVCPGVLKAAFIVGGRKGDCTVTRRTKDGWGAPAFFNLTGGSFGAQIGASSTDFVLLIMNEDGLKGLLEDKFEIGGETGIAAGPVGREASASTNLTLDAGILSYSRSKGLFAGVALKGVAITPDNDLNRAYYSKTAREVLAEGLRPPSPVRALSLALSRYSVK